MRVRLAFLLLIHLGEEVRTLVVLNIVFVEIVLGFLRHRLGLEFCHSSVLYLLVELLSVLLFLPLPCDAFIFDSLRLVVLLFF